MDIVWTQKEHQEANRTAFMPLGMGSPYWPYESASDMHHTVHNLRYWHMQDTIEEDTNP